MANDLKQPAGYDRLVAFDTTRHAGLGLPSPRDYRWCAGLNAVPLAASEFFRAALHYPIAFVRGPDGNFAAMAILGLRQGENLFVDDRGSWRTPTYLPAYVRRYPFCLAQSSAASAEQRKAICVQEDQLSADAEPALIDRSGKTTAAWEPIRQLLEAVEANWQQTLQFSARLAKLDLLVPFEAVAVPKLGAKTQLTGLHRIDESRLKSLTPSQLHRLVDRGELRAIYAQLLSLENFGLLLDLLQERDATDGH